MRPENKVVNMVWIGDKLTKVSELSIRSFLHHGHQVRLFADVTLTRPENLPDSVILETIYNLDLKKLHDDFTCTSHFSDYLRAKIISAYGGWYADTDEICLRPIDIDSPYVFISEFPDGLVNGCIFKAPADCAFLNWMIAKIEGMDTLKPASWISVGPELFRQGVREFNLHQYVRPPIEFDPLSPVWLNHFVAEPNWDKEFPSESFTAHLRTSYWNNSVLNPDSYISGTMFHDLKVKYGVSAD